MNQSEQKFSAEEWETCLKVLNTLKETPFLNPDNKTFSGLITKIHKNAKRQSRHENYSEMKSHDLAVNSNAVLMQKALSGVSAFMMMKKKKFNSQNFKFPKTATAVTKVISMPILSIPDCALYAPEKTMKNVLRRLILQEET
ncbi:hypothetical protein [Chryseobacterium sp. CH1]|uniref:hypothetical protein n=1 Tax=Chryseobacterium sp. CH1 TaxID=713551 RepID=UPI00100B37E4|nr:hypothetical protein [Chryseobacterium sp. CH1]